MESTGRKKGDDLHKTEARFLKAKKAAILDLFAPIDLIPGSNVYQFVKAVEETLIRSKGEDENREEEKSKGTNFQAKPSPPFVSKAIFGLNIYTFKYCSICQMQTSQHGKLSCCEKGVAIEKEGHALPKLDGASSALFVEIFDGKYTINDGNGEAYSGSVSSTSINIEKFLSDPSNSTGRPMSTSNKAKMDAKMPNAAVRMICQDLGWWQGTNSSSILPSELAELSLAPATTTSKRGVFSVETYSKDGKNSIKRKGYAPDTNEMDQEKKIEELAEYAATCAYLSVLHANACIMINRDPSLVSIFGKASYKAGDASIITRKLESLQFGTISKYARQFAILHRTYAKICLIMSAILDSRIRGDQDEANWRGAKLVLSIAGMPQLIEALTDPNQAEEMLNAANALSNQLHLMRERLNEAFENWRIDQENPSQWFLKTEIHTSTAPKSFLDYIERIYGAKSVNGDSHPMFSIPRHVVELAISNSVDMLNDKCRPLLQVRPLLDICQQLCSFDVGKASVKQTGAISANCSYAKQCFRFLAFSSCGMVETVAPKSIIIDEDFKTVDIASKKDLINFWVSLLDADTSSTRGSIKSSFKILRNISSAVKLASRSNKPDDDKSKFVEWESSDPSCHTVLNNIKIGQRATIRPIGLQSTFHSLAEAFFVKFGEFVNFVEIGDARKNMARAEPLDRNKMIETVFYLLKNIIIVDNNINEMLAIRIIGIDDENEFLRLSELQNKSRLLESNIIEGIKGSRFVRIFEDIVKRQNLRFGENINKNQAESLKRCLSTISELVAMMQTLMYIQDLGNTRAAEFDRLRIAGSSDSSIDRSILYDHTIGGILLHDAFGKMSWKKDGKDTVTKLCHPKVEAALILYVALLRPIEWNVIESLSKYHNKLNTRCYVTYKAAEDRMKEGLLFSAPRFDSDKNPVRDVSTMIEHSLSRIFSKYYEAAVIGEELVYRKRPLHGGDSISKRRFPQTLDSFVDWISFSKNHEALDPTEDVNRGSQCRLSSRPPLTGTYALSLSAISSTVEQRWSFYPK